MRKMKTFLRTVKDGNGKLLFYVDLRTMLAYQGRWWTKAREPGEMRPGRVKNLVRYGKRMRGFLRLDVYV